jgi:hypothetical protein
LASNSGATILSFFLGEITDGIIVLGFIAINTILAFVQEYHSEQSLKALQRYVVPEARVRREGKEVKVKTSELVPGDIVATGETHSVREFVEVVGKYHGMDIVWQGKGLEEKGIDQKTGKVIVEIDPIYFRPNEVEYLQGDSTKTREILGWKPKTTFEQLAQLMAEADLEYAKRELARGKPVVTQKKFIV